MITDNSAPKSQNIKRNNSLISLRQISKVFGFDDMQTIALNEISLDVKKGEFLAIMGPSGCGKTTLLNIIGLLEKPNSGDYIFNSRNTRRFSLSRQAKIRNQEIGFIFQNFNLINSLTVIDNVILPLNYRRGFNFKNLEKASKLLKIFNLSEREYYKPNQLSGGQKQRVAIARALINKPSIILADEPTGNLDSVNSKIIMSELNNLHREGNTIIMVTHNPNLLEFASRVIYMRDGKIESDKNLINNYAFKITKRTISRQTKQRNYRSKKQKKKRLAKVKRLIK